MNNTENELNVNPKPENHAPVQPNEVREDNQMELLQLRKTAKLAKVNFLITIVGLGFLGYLHFSSQSSIDESLAKGKTTLKQEMGKEFASKEDLQALSTDLTTKIDGVGGRISGLEVQGEQFQEELHKSAQLNARVNELQASLKKSQTTAKPAASASAKGKTQAKPTSKSTKKGKK